MFLNKWEIIDREYLKINQKVNINIYVKILFSFGVISKTSHPVLILYVYITLKIITIYKLAYASLLDRLTFSKISSVF